MPRESKRSKVARAVEVCHRMEKRYPSATPALDFTTPFTTVIAVMLSAQTTDAAVNRVTPTLFARWPDAPSLAAADPDDVAEVIHSLGFYRTKSKNAVAAAQMIVAEHDGEVPHTMAELCALPGVGRKTANIVLNKAFGQVEGIAVDTHVYRIATRLRFTHAPTPAAAEKDLLAIIPSELWGAVNETWIRFGRDTCRAQRPACDGCAIADLCPSCGRCNGNPTARKNAKRKGQ